MASSWFARGWSNSLSRATSVRYCKYQKSTTRFGSQKCLTCTYSYAASRKRQSLAANFSLMLSIHWLNTYRLSKTMKSWLEKKEYCLSILPRWHRIWRITSITHWTSCISIRVSGVTRLRKWALQWLHHRINTWKASSCSTQVMNWMNLDIPWHRDMVAETFLGHLISTKLMKTTMVSDAAVSKVPICQTLQLNYPVFAPKMHILASRNLFLKRVTSRGQTQKAALTSRNLLKSTANYHWGEILFSNLCQ